MLKPPEGITRPPRVLKRMTIATCLLWAFLVMALVPLSLVTYLTSTISDQSLRAEVTNNLRAIADSAGTPGGVEAKRRLQCLCATAGRLPAG